jgi:hypothetical protein
VDLFQLARQNAAELLRRFQEAKARAKDGGRLLDGFARRVEVDACVSINVRPSVLTELIHGRKHQNIYEWAAEQSRRYSRPVEEILRNKLGKHYIRRVHFDDTFENGRRFRYGTLNIGGLGASRYGQFCAVLRSEFIETEDRLAYVMNDSLHDYMVTETEVDVSRLQHDSATHSDVPYLAGVKHARELAGKPESDWPGMVWSVTTTATWKRFSSKIWTCQPSLKSAFLKPSTTACLTLPSPTTLRHMMTQLMP